MQLTRRFLLSVVASVLVAGFGSRSLSGAEADQGTVAIGTRVEMFVDDWLMDSTRSRGSVSLQLQTPVKREIVLV